MERHGDIALQGRKVEDAAREWDMYGFSEREVEAWLSARCFSARAAYDLAREAFSPEQAAILTDAGPDNYMDTVGLQGIQGRSEHIGGPGDGKVAWKRGLRCVRPTGFQQITGRCLNLG